MCTFEFKNGGCEERRKEEERCFQLSQVLDRRKEETDGPGGQHDHLAVYLPYQNIITTVVGKVHQQAQRVIDKMGVFTGLCGKGEMQGLTVEVSFKVTRKKEYQVGQKMALHVTFWPS